ncbi:MAG: lysine--tRNA ligase [Candidatus Marsarchaeota archaeon]|nr:lysine--tRNA ligase [Candidatus Marsarchaeota archaeon]
MAETQTHRGTRFWIDKLGDEVVGAFPDAEVYRTENGIGASGYPHIGSLSDAVRSYAVKLSIESRGRKAEHIAYSDDKDGLRKIPKGMPSELGKYIGVPVTSVPDPSGCHSSFGSHMGGLLLEALDQLGIKYTAMSATEVYRSGRLNPYIHKILVEWRKVGAIIYEETGQDKYTKTLPYMPVCAGCGRIYTTVANTYDQGSHTVVYECTGGEIGGKWFDGCGHRGEAPLSAGEGKLAWKTEFAARWAALGISFEAYGKELTSSIRTNDRVCREVLGVRPPVHTRYELFITKEGKKMSKSSGELVTPAQWLRYGSPQSLLLLMLKRFEGARAVGVEDVPIYMAELDQLEDIYFGVKHLADRDEEADKLSLYRYVHLLNPPAKPRLHPPYNLLTYLVAVAPNKSDASYIVEKLRAYGYTAATPDQEADLVKRVELARNWVSDQGAIVQSTAVSGEDAKILRSVIDRLREKNDEKGYQEAVYEAAKQNNVDTKRAFSVVYTALIGQSSGPRIGSYIAAMGKENVIKRLEEACSTQT